LDQYQVDPWKEFVAGRLEPHDEQVLREHSIREPGDIEALDIRKVLDDPALKAVLIKLGCRVVLK
jgi:hypothetical protein